MYKKIISTLLCLMLLSLALAGCSKKTGESMVEDKKDAIVDGNKDASTGNMQPETETSEITESISEAETADEELDVEEVDSDLDAIDSELENW